MKDIFLGVVNYFDPYKQSAVFFRFNFLGGFFIVAATVLLSLIYINPVLVKGGYIENTLLSNPVTGLPNFLFHEFGHRFFCYFPSKWFCYFSGTMTEFAVPFVLYTTVLRFNGGRYLLPFIGIWLSTTFYSIGSYAYFGSTKELALASSDMVSSAKAGTQYGDWYTILEPFGLLEYDKVIGNSIIVLGCFCLVISLYSIYYYLKYEDQYPLHPHEAKPGAFKVYDEPTIFDDIYQASAPSRAEKNKTTKDEEC